MPYFEYFTHRERQTIQTHLLHVLLYNQQHQLHTTTFDLTNWYIQKVEKPEKIMPYFLHYHPELVFDSYYFLEEEQKNITSYQHAMQNTEDHSAYVKLKKNASLKSIQFLDSLIKKQKQVWITEFVSAQEASWLIDLLKNNRKTEEVREA